MRAIDSLLTFMEEKSYHKAQQRVTLGRKDATKTFRITCADNKSVTTCTCNTPRRGLSSVCGVTSTNM